MPKGFGVRAVKISSLNKSIGADFKKVFMALGRAALELGQANWVNAAKEALNLGSAIKVASKPEHLAWLLIQRAMTRAILCMVEENSVVFKNRPNAVDSILDKIDLSLEDSKISINRRFFEHPGECPIIEAMQTPYAQWLVWFGLEQTAARAMAGRLRGYFIWALGEEWRERPTDYEPLSKAVLDTPFSIAEEREQSWLQYAGRLEKQIDQSIFDEHFGLRQIYVPLRAYYEEKLSKEDQEEYESLGPERHRNNKTRKVAFRIHDYLDEWLNRDTKGSTIKVICGGPGSGKSSFCKVFAAKHAFDPGLRVLFIPLHLIDVSAKLERAIGDYFNKSQLLNHNPLEQDKLETGTRYLLIFDGLDELAQQGKVGAEVAREFIAEVERTVSSYRAGGKQVKVLFSGRNLAVEANAAQFRDDQQVLHLIPYLIRGEEREEYKGGEDLLAMDQRDDWWKLYGDATGLEYKSIPNHLKEMNLEEITAQPLLSYLVALSLRFSGDEIQKTSSLNDIYHRLLKGVHDRGWEESQHPAVRDVPFALFERILEEIALATWHGDGRTTTIGDIRKKCEAAGLQGLLESFEKGAEEGLNRLLLAFYFRECGGICAPQDRTFEFTHKSFGEYLTALRIVRGLNKIHQELERKKQDYDSGWDLREALQHWAIICGPQPMDEYLFDFARNEIRNKGKETAEARQQTLCDMISHLLKQGMPMECISSLTYKQMERQARNAEEALLALHYACARVTERVSEISWPSPTAFGEWLSRLQGQRSGGENHLAYSCLGFIAMNEGALLYFKDLFGANLVRANLLEANLERANLERANLVEASLVEASLVEANLVEANLVEANLVGANLVGANLVGANLERANLERANLAGANLAGAMIDEIQPNGAKEILEKYTKPQAGGVSQEDAEALGRLVRLSLPEITR